MTDRLLVAIATVAVLFGVLVGTGQDRLPAGGMDCRGAEARHLCDLEDGRLDLVRRER